MRLIKMASVGVLLLALAACQDRGQKQTFGTIAGAALGGLAGSQIGSGTGQLAAVGAGVLLGALVGGEIGKSLDRADRAMMARTTEQALETKPSGTAAVWRNPDSGNSGTITPRPAYQNSTGRYCREYQQTVTVGGESQQGYGTACRQPDGSWRIVNTQ